jgi:hypothetical protein
MTTTTKTELLTEDQAKKFPLVAARRYFRARWAVTDLHTAYAEALRYYGSLTRTAK